MSSDAMVNSAVEPLVYVSLCEGASGNTMVMLTLDELAVYNAHPDQFAANHFGMSLAYYREFCDNKGKPLCGARTRKGKLCGNTVDHLSGNYEELHRNAYCHKHG